MLRLAFACVLALVGAGAEAGSDRPFERTAPQHTDAKPAADHCTDAVQWQHDHLEGRVFYQIFVRSFRDSDGDGIGDLAGLTASLDFLNDGDPTSSDDLGVEGIWLMPIFESPSYHGYDVTDYLSIEPDYGSLDDFRVFLAAAHERGIAVIVDLVMNHSSAQHPWFVASSSSPTSPWRSWYTWRDDDPGWTQPWGGGPTWHLNPRGEGYFYGVFWSGMPDLDFAEPAVRSEMLRIAEHWIAVGVDGFRLDATRHLFAEGDGELQNDRPQTHSFLRELSTHVRRVDPTTLLVGENWTSTQNISAYYGSTDCVSGGDELPASFSFPIADAIVAAIRHGDPDRLRLALAEQAEWYPAGVLAAPFLRNHDQMRLGSELDRDPAGLRLAASVLLTLPGIPFLYYGEEVGLENGGPERDDRLKRTPMPWDASSPGGGFSSRDPWFPFAPGREQANVAAQDGDPESLLSHYRHWIRARRNSAALSRGTLQIVPLETTDPILAFVRQSGSDRVLVLHNFGTTVATVVLPAELGANGSPPLIGAAVATRQSVTLDARASVVFPLPPTLTANHQRLPGTPDPDPGTHR